jgi:SOS-response transcriptional repressor LexA
MADLKVSLNSFYEILSRLNFKSRPTAEVFLIALLAHGCMWCTNVPVKKSRAPAYNFLRKRKIVILEIFGSIQSFKISRPQKSSSSSFWLLAVYDV